MSKLFKIPIRHNVGFVILSFLLCAPSLIAQKTYATLELEGNEHEVNETFTVKYAIVKEGQRLTKAPGIIEPDFPNTFQIKGKNSANSSFNYNGKIKSEIGINYYLTVSKAGTYTVPAATFTLDGKNYTSNTKTVKITKPVVNDNLSGDLILQLVPNKRNVYVGESFQMDLIYYSAFNTNGFQLMELPKFDGFVSKMIEGKQAQKIKTINGKKYVTARVASFVLTPIKSGNLKTPSVKGQISLVDNRSFFPREIKKEIQTGSTKINVKPLPKPQPKDFNGLVGEFKLDYKVDKTNLPVNDAVTFKIIVSGNGNLENLNEIPFELPSAFEGLAPTQKSNLNTNSGSTSGSKTFEYVAIPRQNGDFTINSTSLTYFNPKLKKYATLKTTEKTITVTGQGSSTPGASGTNLTKNVVESKNQDIRYLQEVSSLSQPDNNGFTTSALRYILLVVGLLAFPLTHFALKEKNINVSELKSLKKSNANKVAKQYLKKAEKELNGDRNKFYELVDEAINNFLLGKLMIDQKELKASSLRSILAEQNVTAELIERTIAISNDCKMARYSPAVKNPEGMYESAMEIIKELEKQIM